MANGKSMQILWEGKESEQLILSPAVGYYSHGPEPGSFISGGAFVGKLRILNTTYDLYLPKDLHGRVLVAEERDKIQSMDYGRELFRLVTDKSFMDRTEQEEAKDADSNGFDASEEGYVVRAFTTGIFYAKPSPDSPPFVVEGQEIEKGKALGLIEVMKTFNHIVFHGTDDSDIGKIKKIFVKDAQEVKSGQPLFLIE